MRPELHALHACMPQELHKEHLPALELTETSLSQSMIKLTWISSKEHEKYIYCPSHMHQHQDTSIQPLWKTKHHRKQYRLKKQYICEEEKKWMVSYTFKQTLKAKNFQLFSWVLKVLHHITFRLQFEYTTRRMRLEIKHMSSVYCAHWSW